MVRTLPIDMIVPQHGAPMAGAAVAEFIAWAEGFACGVDLVSEANYAVPA
jgi:flavorubredoxin